MKRLAILICLLYTSSVMAFSWRDLWLRPDQQGLQLLQQGKPAQAAKTFTDKGWQGVAHYRAGHYCEAASQFQQLTNADAHYNRGNALALQGDYQAAIAAYEQALKQEPQHTDARYNLEIIKKRMQQQQSSGQQQPQANNQQQDPNTNKQNTEKDNSKADKGNQNKPQPSNQQSTADKQETAKGQAATKPTNNKQPDKQEDSSKPSETIQSKESNQQTETQQANEQWLQQIPDDPGGLLRQKFLRDYERRHAG